MGKVIAGVEKKPALVVFYKDGIDRKPNFASGSLVPPNMEAIKHQSAAVQQIDLRVRHSLFPLAT